MALQCPAGINIWNSENLRDGDWLNLNSRLRWQLSAKGVSGWFLIGFSDPTFGKKETCVIILIKVNLLPSSVST